MRERNGVRLGQRVQDLDGTPLGKVVKLYDEGFAARKGLPILFRSDYVIRYDEVRGVRDGELVVSRSRRDLFDLAAGYVPPAWRVPAPPDFPSAATPPEARLLVEDLARGAIVTEAATPSSREPEPPLAAPSAAEPGAEEERRYATRDASVSAPPR